MSQQVALSEVQTLWLKELGVGMLWGRELQAGQQEQLPIVQDTPLAKTALPVSTHDVWQNSVNQQDAEQQSVGLIKRASPEGRVKKGRVSHEQVSAIQTIQKGFDQLARQTRRAQQNATIHTHPLPCVQANTWQELEEEIKQQYLQWGWVQDANEILVGQEGASPLNILVIEEMPGADDVLEGVPFTGNSGQLLANMLAPLGISKEDIAITSLLKFHARDENIPVEYAIPFLQKQIQLLQPKIIWLLGTRAAQSFLKKEDSAMDVLRAQEWSYPLTETQSIPVIVSHHPSLMLVDSALKADIWDDLLRLSTYR